MKTNKIVAVITGDIINSSVLNSERKNHLIVELEHFVVQNANALLPIQFYRGDSFQVMTEKEKAAEICVYLEAIILSVAETWARLSIGIGSVTKMLPGNVLQSDGEAFQLSGQQLDKMKKEGRLLKIAVNNKKYQPILSATFHLAESIILNWKPGQAKIIAQMPFTKTQKEIAHRLGISEAAVSKAIKSSNWSSIENFINGFAETVKDL